ncbi:MAG: hypothetical protein EOP59_05370 [Sphingomonadales bacterium]|nr:MAG: hypothetical protein EOP59_05370 [Sphingomonadales bacterium]
MADTVPGDTSTTATLAVGAAVDVIIETLGDHDWYAVTLVAGQRYTFSGNASAGTTTSTDGYLALRNSSGVQVAADDDGGVRFLPELHFTATYSGTSGADTVAGNTGTTGTIALDGTLTGAIDTLGDHDWYAITLVAGQRYTFQTTSSGTGVGADTTITIRDSTGAFDLGYNDDGGSQGSAFYSSLTFTAQTSGTYYVDVGGYNNEDTGTYRLSVSQPPPLSLYTNDQIATQLTTTYWNGAPRHFNVSAGGSLTVNTTALTAEGQVLALAALQLWTDVTGVAFTSVTTGTAHITFDDDEEGAFASSNFTGGITTSATVNVGTGWLEDYGTTLNSYAFQTYIHEIGHALGLGHAGPYNGDATYGVDNSYINDAWATTVMSYFSQDENTYFDDLGFTRQYVVSPIVADILAVQALYGTTAATRTGATTYGFNNTSGRAIFDATANPNVTYTVFDNGGIDTLDYSGFSQTQRIDLNAEAFSNVGGRLGNVTIARGTLIENAIGGSGVDTIIGNSADNLLRGMAGADIIDGGEGIDTARFSGNRSAYTITNGSGTTVTVSGTDGTDTLTNVERLQFDNGTYVRGGGSAGFGATTLAVASFGSSAEAGGWADNRTYPRVMADVNGDGREDIIGFGGAGTYISLANGSGGFGAIYLAAATFGSDTAAGGWTNSTTYPRMVADINGDGRADLIGFGGAGVYAALGNGSGGFGAIYLAINSFGASAAGGGWSSQSQYPRTMGDVNGDGRDDIIGFGSAGTFVSLANANGTFGAIALAYNGFGSSEAGGGWANNEVYPRMVADLNGDGRDDLVGFGSSGLYVAYADGPIGGAAHFGPTTLLYAGFGAGTSGGWSNQNLAPRMFADVNGDGRDDIVGFASGGVYTALSTTTGGDWVLA